MRIHVVPPLVFLLLAAAPGVRGQPLAALAAPGGAKGGGPDPAGAYALEVRPAVAEVRIDGVMDEEAWREAQTIELAYETYPGDNTPAPVRTECRATFDDRALYLGCLARDAEPARIRARFSDRDKAVQDDHIAFWIDPFNNRRSALKFRVNPYGVQMDGVYDGADAAENLAWDAIWSSAGRIVDEGYVVEVGIPFRSLRFPRASAPQTWGLVVERFYPRSERHQLRSVPLDRNNSCVLCQGGTLTGLTGIAPGRDLELSPTLTAHQTARREEESAGLQAGAGEMEMGLTMRWGILPNVTVSGTLNPDFSQVEADVAQLEVNTRFALSYPEKRPFFLEGAGVFQTFVPAVFTRKVVDPTFGLKLTGEEGPSTFGVLVTRDRVNTLLFPGPETSRATLLEEEVTTGAARYQRALGNASTVGVLYTGRAGAGYANHLAGADGYLRLSRSNHVRVQLVRTETDYPDSVARAFGQPEDRFGGNVFIGQLSHDSRRWSGYLQYQDIASGYRADAGWSRRVGVTVARGQVERLVWGRPGGWFSRLSAGLFAERLDLQGGGVADQAVALVAKYAGPWQSTLSLTAGPRRERFAGTVYDLTDAAATLSLRPSAGVGIALRSGWGEEVDYDNTREGDFIRLEPTLELQTGRHLGMELSHVLHRLSFRGEEVFTANLTQARALYHFNTRAMVRGLVQYSTLARNAALYDNEVAPRTGAIFAQVLFAYRVNPPTMVFIGFSNSRLDDGESAFRDTDRTVFLKLGYAWQP
jgi:hypothetical protein